LGIRGFYFTENFQIDNIPGPSISFFSRFGKKKKIKEIEGRKIKRGIFVKPNNLKKFRVFVK
tara:strand:+ start:1480 stop:1665 length:186 start_codon:yes stop_codon:yes gene_type:complete